MFIGSILAFLFAVSVLFGAVRLGSEELSLTELQRRAKRSKGYEYRLRQQVLLPSLVVMVHIGVWISLIAFTVTASVWQGWLGGFVISLVAVALYPVLTRTSGAAALSSYLYKKVEAYFMVAAEKTPSLWRFFYGHTPQGPSVMRRFSSREELAEAIQASSGVIGQDELRLLEGAISFGDSRVADVMTPRSVIQSVQKDEFIGPLVLDELHSKGHSRLPVIDGDINNVVGVLNLRSLLSLDIRKSESAGKLMDTKVFLINEKDSLQKALSAFVKQRYHMFVVVNDHNETVGLLTLEDVIEALIGREIVDENDVHDDMRVAAKEKSKENNSGPNSTHL